MVAGMKKTTKRVTKKAKDEDQSPLVGFFKPSDFSKKRVGFPNLHLTIAAESMKHAERARAGKLAIEAHFRDLSRVLDAGKRAGGQKLTDSMVAATTYCAQIIVSAEAVSLNERQALMGVDQIGQLVDMKQIRENFHTKVKRAVYAELAVGAKRRRR